MADTPHIRIWDRAPAHGAHSGRIHMQGDFGYQEDSPTTFFTVRDHHMYFSGAPLDTLSETDQLALMNVILGKYRSLSKKDCGMFSSALGITDQGNIYIAYNSNETDQTAKNCAEANLSNIMSLLTKGEEKFSRIYMMAGMNAKDEHQVLQPKELEQLILPCGRCCDILGEHTLPDATLYALPANNGKTPLTLTDTAENLSDVKPGQAWKLSVHNVLLRDSVVTLSEEQAGAQHTGWANLVGKSEERKQARDERRKYQPSDIKTLLHNVSSGSWCSDEQTQLYNLIMAAAMNAVTGRDSVAAIDANPTWSGINRFMQQQIKEAYDHREPEDKGESTRRIRCAVLRFGDGTFSSATEIRGKDENATPTAEFTALAMHRITNQPITDLWVSEASEKDVQAGRMMTSDKQSLERDYKRRPRKKDAENGKETVRSFAGIDSTELIHPHYIPFNDGTLTDQEVRSITFSPNIGELYAPLYKGSMQIKEEGAGCCPGR